MALTHGRSLQRMTILTPDQGEYHSYNDQSPPLWSHCMIVVLLCDRPMRRLVHTSHDDCVECWTVRTIAQRAGTLVG